MPPEDEFIKTALRFLEEIGADAAAVKPETNLIDSGILDSLGILAFLDFLEQQSGESIEIDGMTIESISTLHNAYQFMVMVSDSAA